MGVVDRIMAAHNAGEIDVIDTPAKVSSEKFGCALSTVFEARKRLRVIHDRPQIRKYQIVLDAHEQGIIDLQRDPIEEIASHLNVHKDVVNNAICRSDIKRKSFKPRRRANYRYWYRIKKQMKLMVK